ncbi:MAG: hypothetical protein ACR2PO_13745 [Methyloligellaceae bacterium]
MGWIAWLITAAALFFVGAYFVRAGKPRIVGLYVIACVVLFLLWLTNLGHVFGSSFASWVGVVLSVLAPGTVVLAIWAVERNRIAVMGRRDERDALVTGALIYGASDSSGSGNEAGDLGGGGEA